jgi:hypothetical protein
LNLSKVHQNVKQPGLDIDERGKEKLEVDLGFYGGQPSYRNARETSGSFCRTSKGRKEIQVNLGFLGDRPRVETHEIHLDLFAERETTRTGIS